MSDYIRICEVEKYYGSASNVTKAVDRVSFQGKKKQHPRSGSVLRFRPQADPQPAAQLPAQVKPHPGSPLMIPAVAAGKPFFKDTGKLFAADSHAVVLHRQTDAVLPALRKCWKRTVCC